MEKKEEKKSENSRNSKYISRNLKIQLVPHTLADPSKINDDWIISKSYNRTEEIFVQGNNTNATITVSQLCPQYIHTIVMTGLFTTNYVDAHLQAN